MKTTTASNIWRGVLFRRFSIEVGLPSLFLLFPLSCATWGSPWTVS